MTEFAERNVPKDLELLPELHSKDPESALLGFILEKLAEKDLQRLAVVEQLLSKSDDELVNFLDSIESLGDNKS
jgi:hypothetical protein